MKADAHPALVVDGHGAQEFAVLAAEKNRASDLDLRRGEIGAEKLRGGLQHQRGNHLSVEHENQRQAPQAQARFGFEIVDAHGRIPREGVQRPDGRGEARHRARAAVEGNRAEFRGQRALVVDGVRTVAAKTTVLARWTMCEKVLSNEVYSVSRSLRFISKTTLCGA